MLLDPSNPNLTPIFADHSGGLGSVLGVCESVTVAIGTLSPLLSKPPQGPRDTCLLLRHTVMPRVLHRLTDDNLGYTS